MRTKLISLLFALAVIVVGPVMACQKGRLEVYVVDCSGTAVPGVTVTVACKSGGDVTAQTDNDGKAVFSVDPHDVEKTSVTQNVASASGKCSSSPCTLKVCYSDSIIDPS